MNLSKDYTIPNGTRAPIGYQRNECPGFFETGACEEKTKLVISLDLHNNVHRVCSVMGIGDGERIWKVRTPMRDQHFKRYYLVQHLRTGQTRIVRSGDMTNMY